MNDRERRIFEMITRAYAFLFGNKADFTQISVIAQTITILQTEKQTLSDLGVDKVSKTIDSKDSTIFRGDARELLRDAMESIAEFWRPMAKNYGGAINKFHFEYGSDQLLIDDAGSFIQEAEPLKEAFTDRGMPDNFITDLTTKRNNFILSIEQAEAAKIERIGTNAGFREPLKRCQAAVEDVDPIVKMIYRDNPSKLAEWTSASRIEKR
jgi:hypothetical protein